MTRPPQAQYLAEKFDTENFIHHTFTNDNIHNTWMLKKEDVVLLVEESLGSIIISLGRRAHPFREEGQVKSQKVPVNYVTTSRDLSEINNVKKEALENAFEGTSDDDIYEAFAQAFGEEKIISDDR